jgi:hypothetical protein
VASASEFLELSQAVALTENPETPEPCLLLAAAAVSQALVEKVPGSFDLCALKAGTALSQVETLSGKSALVAPSETSDLAAFHAPDSQSIEPFS